MCTYHYVLTLRYQQPNKVSAGALMGVAQGAARIPSVIPRRIKRHRWNDLRGDGLGVAVRFVDTIVIAAGCKIGCSRKRENEARTSRRTGVHGTHPFAKTRKDGAPSFRVAETETIRLGVDVQSNT